MNRDINLSSKPLKVGDVFKENGQCVFGHLANGQVILIMGSTIPKISLPDSLIDKKLERAQREIQLSKTFLKSGKQFAVTSSGHKRIKFPKPFPTSPEKWVQGHFVQAQEINENGEIQGRGLKVEFFQNTWNWISDDEKQISNIDVVGQMKYQLESFT
jgi:hypothetical protein